MKRVLGIALAALLFAAIFYVSRFWGYMFWSGEGLFGIDYLRPQGDLARRAVRGTGFAPYYMLIWAVGSFLALSLVQWIWAKIFRS